MTVSEFSNEFDISYNSIASNSAPGIDLYEKSVYLTKAQLEIIKNYFNPLGNKYRKGFENSSKRRNDLKELIRSYSTITPIPSNDNNIIDGTSFFEIPNESFLIIEERAKLNRNNNCSNSSVGVVPKTHDEFGAQINNPFKKPNGSVVWRLDIESQNNNKAVELISEFPITEYRIRYIKYPTPIILADLDTEFPGEGLSIDNINIKTECNLSESIHREILDRAIELALSDYKPNLLSVKTQLNSRNE